MFRFFRDVANAVVRRQRAFKTIEEAYTLEKNGKKEEALNLCEELVKQNPNNAQFRFTLARLQKALDRPVLPDADYLFQDNRPKAMH
jgi:hypothetical protein